MYFCCASSKSHSVTGDVSRLKIRLQVLRLYLDGHHCMVVNLDYHVNMQKTPLAGQRHIDRT